MRRPRRSAELHQHRCNARQIEGTSAVGECAQWKPNRLHRILPTRSCSKARALIGLLNTAAQRGNLQRCLFAEFIDQRDGVGQVAEQGDGLRVARSLRRAHREELALRKVAAIGRHGPVDRRCDRPVHDKRTREVGRAAARGAVHRVGGHPGKRRVVVVLQALGLVRHSDQRHRSTRARDRCRSVGLEVVEHDPILRCRDPFVDDGRRRRDRDWTQTLVLTPEVFLSGRVVLHNPTNHRERRRFHHVLRFGVSDRCPCWACEIVEAAAVEVVVVCAVHVGRLAQAFGALEDVETVSNVGVGASADIAIRGAVHQHERHAVRIRARGSEEVGRRDRNQEANVADLVVRRRKRAIEEAVVTSGDALTAA